MMSGSARGRDNEPEAHIELVKIPQVPMAPIPQAAGQVARYFGNNASDHVG